MSEPRKAKKPGPLLYQRRLRSARELHRLRMLEPIAVAMPDPFKAAIAVLPAALDALSAAIGGAPQDSDWRLP